MIRSRLRRTFRPTYDVALGVLKYTAKVDLLLLYRWRAPHLADALDITFERNLTNEKTEEENYIPPTITASFLHHHLPHHDRYSSLNVANELSALPPYSNMVLLEQLLPSAALSTHAGSQ